MEVEFLARGEQASERESLSERRVGNKSRSRPGQRYTYIYWRDFSLSLSYSFLNFPPGGEGLAETSLENAHEITAVRDRRTGFM